MKEYTVKEIADLLKTNPETVRRWIRSGKLEAVKSSRKEGNMITEISLHNFLKTTPKYAGIAAGTLGLLGLTALMPGVSAFATGVITGLLSQSSKNAKQASKKDVILALKTSITSTKAEIQRKKEEIKRLSDEILMEENKISEVQELLRQLEKSKEE